MSPQPAPDLGEDKERETNVLIEAAPGSSPAKAPEEDSPGRQLSPVAWLRMLARELHWSFVLGVVATYGVSQGLGGGINRVASDYYWKDVQRVQPSVAQVYHGITSIPWMVKPLWGLLTDVLPVAGYRRRPYFILAGTPELKNIWLTCRSTSKVFDDLGGEKGALGLLTIPPVLTILSGMLLKEVHISNFPYGQAHKKFVEASGKMLTTLKCPEVWRPCVYMYVSLALSVDIQEGMFYWYTDRTAGLSFHEGFIGFMFAVGSVGYLVAVILYQNILKDHSYRSLLFSSQLLLSLSGMLDLILVLRLNLKMGIPDYYFAVIDEGVSKMINRIKWMPLLVLSSKLCPTGIEGTFYALLMSIDNIGALTGSWIGGLLLHLLRITRTEFKNLWAAIIIRNVMRLLPLALLFLVPSGDPNTTLLPSDLLNEDDETHQMENIELTSLAVDRVSFPDNSPQERRNREGLDVQQDDDEVSLLANRG
ncbi:putative folate-biopterin transporter 2 [Dichanthelium oligosanthes]|uniref:Putative folate-biopterin transporter 2 n=1 Tax=Dichanthelium oligosanthes TaxID=888268 RepID=A0A1E5VKU5_9POAL|nr:putative folate-biopterin transporter 2 [Dichanthelium oligosanthes]